MSFSKNTIVPVMRRGLMLWFQHARLLFLGTFFLTVGVGGYILYTDVYRSEWTSAEKQAYAEREFQSTVLNEGAFMRALNTMNTRATLHTTPLTDIRNPFRKPVNDVPVPQTQPVPAPPASSVPVDNTPHSP